MEVYSLTRWNILLCIMSTRQLIFQINEIKLALCGVCTHQQHPNQLIIPGIYRSWVHNSRFLTFQRRQIFVNYRPAIIMLTNKVNKYFLFKQKSWPEHPKIWFNGLNDDSNYPLLFFQNKEKGKSLTNGNLYSILYKLFLNNMIYISQWFSFHLKSNSIYKVKSQILPSKQKKEYNKLENMHTFSKILIFFKAIILWVGMWTALWTTLLAPLPMAPKILISWEAHR